LSFSAKQASLFLGMAVDDTSQIESNIRNQIPKSERCPTCGYYNTWTPEIPKGRIVGTWIKLIKFSFISILVGPVTISAISYFIWYDVTPALLLKILKPSLIISGLGIFLSGIYAYIAHRNNRYFQEFKLKEIKLTVDTGATLAVNCLGMLFISFLTGLVGGYWSHSITLGIFLGTLVIAFVLPIILLRSASYLIW
jgi:uncharacterized membrane protein (DUF485 family)